MIARIGKRLGVHWGTRSKRAGEEKGRPFAFDQAIDRRTLTIRCVTGALRQDLFCVDMCLGYL